MTLGTFQDYFIPVLASLKKNGTMHRRENMSDVVSSLKISPEDLALRTPKGTPVFRSRIHWAQAFLAQAGAVVRPQRGYLEITERGVKLLEDNPLGFTTEKFDEFPDYADAWGGRKKEPNSNSDAQGINISTQTPLESIESAINELERTISTDIVQRVQSMSPKFLELVVLKLLRAMGYGDSETSIEHLGGPGDEGVDGVINQDSLGLQRIYVQAKRYKSENTIGRPDLQKFVGALSGLGANGGVFITTSNFSSEAKEYANKNISQRIILIDGEELGKLMVRYGIGVQSKNSYQVVDIDEDFFDE
jgi:restriction system protein